MLLSGAGSLDLAFGHRGRAAPELGADVAISSMAALNNGKVLLAGYVGKAEASRFYLARLRSDGSIDPTFGHAGSVQTDFPGDFDSASVIVQQPDGKILLAGGAGQKLAVARYLATGQLDSTFSGDGRQTLSIAFRAECMALQGDGKIVLGDGSIVI